jgi:hypothetical protein
MPLDWSRVGESCRDPFFWDNGKCFVAFCCRHFLHFDYDLTVSRAWHRHQSTRISIIAVTFYYSSMILPFLKLDLGIN